MLHYHNIASGIWAVEPSAADNYIPLVVRFLKGDITTQSATPINPLSYSAHEESESDGGDSGITDRIAILSIQGMITKHSQFCGPMGMKACASILNDLDNDPTIKGVVLKLDTPGGELVGAMILVHALQKFSKSKVAFVEDLCASAGYWIASQCDVIIAYSNRARIGSIGTYCSLMDYRKRLENEGVSVIDVYATKSTKKNYAVRQALSGNTKPLEQEIDIANEMFLTDVKNGRKNCLKGDDSSWNNGEMFYADKALELGLIDAIDDFRNVLNYF